MTLAASRRNVRRRGQNDGFDKKATPIISSAKPKPPPRLRVKIKLPTKAGVSVISHAVIQAKTLTIACKFLTPLVQFFIGIASQRAAIVYGSLSPRFSLFKGRHSQSSVEFPVRLIFVQGGQLMPQLAGGLI